MILGTLLACGDMGMADTGTAMPIEVVACSHPDSAFEAVVEVAVEDDQLRDRVAFTIKQGEYEWRTGLQTLDNLTWWTRMQLYELDCRNEFTYEVHYESE